MDLIAKVNRTFWDTFSENKSRLTPRCHGTTVSLASALS